jgi:glycerol-3-phosphate dehydrogenase
MKRDLGRLESREYDLLVIGGGVYGLCAAWDAALRGLAVALVDKGDFGHATSSNTLRVIHGGLRYLQHGDIRRVRQSIRERTAFMRLAPHLVHPLPFCIPAYGHLLRGREVLSLALRLNDVIGFDRNRLDDPGKHLPAGRVISREECIRLFPGIERKDLTGGALVYDCQTHSSERLMLCLAQSASRAGADLANYVEVTGSLSRQDRVAGVKARDILSGAELDIRARVVANTSGPWQDQVLDLLRGRRPRPRLPLSKAFNILVDRQIVSGYAVGAYSKRPFTDREAMLSKGSRLFFITPWQNLSLIGTVHLPYEGDPDGVRVTEDETQAFLRDINTAYPGAGLTRRDVLFLYGGLLPGMPMQNGGGVQLLKSHRIYDHQEEEGREGLVSVIGVKFTEARYVAEKVVDLVSRKLGKEPERSATPHTPLYGGQVERFDRFLEQEVQRRPPALRAETIRYLVHRYGSAYTDVLKYLDTKSSGDQADSGTLGGSSSPPPGSARPDPCPPAPGKGDGLPEAGVGGGDEWFISDASLIQAEVLHGLHEEMAQKLVDVVFRRTPLGIRARPDSELLTRCAAVMARELGWSQARTSAELAEARAVFPPRI